jgi:hypothetical protein
MLSGYDGLAKSPDEAPRWLSKKFDIQGVNFEQGFGHTCGMPKVCLKSTTQ